MNVTNVRVWRGEMLGSETGNATPPLMREEAIAEVTP